MPSVSAAYPSKSNYLKTADFNGGSMRAKIIDAEIESFGVDNQRKLV
jgi:hypothetical protein